MNMTDFFRFPDSGDKKRKTPCTLCADDKGALVGKINHIAINEHDVVQCLKCGLISIDPIPNREEVAKGSSRFYETTEAKKERKNILRGFRQSFRKGGHFARHYLKRYFTNSQLNILEIGPGDGHFSQGIKHYYPQAEIYYVDVVEDLVRYYHGHFDCRARAGEFSSDLFPNTKFDLIIMRDLLEHSTNPLKLLREAHHSLKPDGLLYFMTPNGLEDLWMINQRFTKTKETTQLLRNHFHFYLPQTLDRLLSEVGFSKELAFKFDLKGHQQGLGHKELTDFPPMAKEAEIHPSTAPLKKCLSMHLWRHHPTEVKWAFFYNHNWFSRLCSFFADRERDVVNFSAPEGRQFFVLAKKLTL